MNRCCVAWRLSHLHSPLLLLLMYVTVFYTAVWPKQLNRLTIILGCGLELYFPNYFLFLNWETKRNYIDNLFCLEGRLWLFQTCPNQSADKAVCFKCWRLPLGTQIYCLNGTDPEGQEVRYGLSFDPGSKEYFRVNSKTGNITLAEHLDREVNLTKASGCKCMYFFISFILPSLHRNKILLTSLSASQMDKAR